uniref:Uncharacterized protein n=1 Tax=Timema douglasi TaxID=61478 RepID=A0A7R8VUU6_TIMDO|nr:unnamed protein product [Timema douglasi]
MMEVYPRLLRNTQQRLLHRLNVIFIAATRSWGEVIPVAGDATSAAIYPPGFPRPRKSPTGITRITPKHRHHWSFHAQQRSLRGRGTGITRNRLELRVYWVFNGHQSTVKRKHIKSFTMAGSALFPPKFSGDTDESFEEWLSTFELLDAANGWKEESRPLFLGLSLSGSAQSVYRSLTDKDRKDFDKVCSELKIVFKKPLLPDLKKAAFVSRYRKTNERLTTLAIDLQRLAMEAYPQFNQESRDELVRDRLIQCIEDSDIRVALRRDPAKTVIDLVSRGEMMEAVSEIERVAPVERVVAATTPVAETNITPVLLQQSIQEAVVGALRLVLEERRPHVTSRVSHQEQNDPARQVFKCSYCKYRGHREDECRVKKRDSRDGVTRDRSGPRCFRCGERGHALEISAINNPVAIYASGAIRSIKLEFLIDSAATECIIREDLWELVKRPEDQLVSSTISIHDDVLNIGGVKVPCHYVKYPNSKKSLFQTHESHVNLAETVTVPARSELFLPHGGIVASEFEELEGCLEPNLQVAAKYGILSACILVTARKNRVPFRLLNTSPDPIVLYKGTSMSHFRPLPEEEKSSPMCSSLTSQTKYRQGAALFDLTQAKRTLKEMKTLLSLRKRQNGVSIVSLALGKKVPAEDDVSNTDPFKLKMGGMINMKALKDGNIKRVDDAYDTGIGTQFSAETNKRDEDEEMMKYIEEQLCKRKGKMVKGSKQEVEESESTDVKYCSPEEAALLAVPDHLRASSTQRSEEMLSNQMLSGIPEVDLGIDAKIRNIEATEEAKLKLLWERHSKKDGPSQFVPTNMAVNFVQHNRFNIEDPEPPKRRERRVEEKKKTVAVGSAPDDNSKRTREGGEKATDDYHYERFKKQFRRY